MADKLDYTIQIDGNQYDVTAADSLHADLANQVENALVVKQSVRKTSIDSIKNDESLAIENLKANIGDPSEAIGVTEKAANGNIIPIVRDADNAFAFKGDHRAEIEVVPSSGGVFTGPIYAPDIDADDGFNINKFQVTNYNSVDTIVRELKGFPVYEWTGTQVLALTEGTPPTMLPFKVILYTGNRTGWENREKLRLINSMPDGTEPFCDTECKFFLINATNDSDNGGRILLGTYTPTSEDNPDPDHKFCTYEELRVKEADHAIDADIAQKLTTQDLGDTITPIYLDDGTATPGYIRAGGTGVKLNNTVKYQDSSTRLQPNETIVEFYAPTDGGTTNQVLLSNGSHATNKAPTWANQNDLSVKEAQKVTESIRDVDIDEIFVTSGGTITPEVLNAYNVTGAINGTAIDEIFNSKTIGSTTSIYEVKQADKATTAESATISDTLHIYELGGAGTDTLPYKPGDTVTSGNYIIYGSTEPNEFTKTGKHCTDAFKTIGNIYIKIPDSL